MDIDRSQFPPSHQVSGMSAQADMWFLRQMEKNHMTIGEALQILASLQKMLADVAIEHEQSPDDK